MTIAEAERFYKSDKKKYNILDNKEFLKWFNGQIKEGYHSYVDVEEMQSLIDHIVNWYEIKYPERELEKREGVIHLDFEDIERMSKHMSIRQLLYRLPHKELCLIEADYRSTGGGLKTLYDEKGNTIGYKPVLFMSLKNKEFDPLNYDSLWELFITADAKTGVIESTHRFEELVTTEEITLVNLLGVLKGKLREIDTTKLEECLYDHACDIELRNRLLQLTALKMVYSKNTIPERGYERAKRFIAEFNKKLELDLDTKEIDEIMNRDYTNGERWEPVLETYVDSKGQQNSYYTVKDMNEKSPLDKAKQFVKTMLRK